MLSNRCIYALKAVLELSKHEGRGLVTITDVAKAQGIPARFLETILIQLKQHGFCSSVRGKEGGYRLAKPAKSIAVGHIVRIFQRPLASNEHRGRKNHGDVFDAVWTKAETALSAVLDSVKFDQLAEKDRSRALQSGDFVI